MFAKGQHLLLFLQRYEVSCLGIRNLFEPQIQVTSRAENVVLIVCGNRQEEVSTLNSCLLYHFM